jgi:hypothetical protein
MPAWPSRTAAPQIAATATELTDLVVIEHTPFILLSRAAALPRQTELVCRISHSSFKAGQGR